MSRTTLGTWLTLGDGSLTMEETVTAVVGDHAEDFDMPALVEAWRSAIDAALPTGITLAGNEFYGPIGLSDAEMAELRDKIASVELTPLLPRHGKSASEEMRRVTALIVEKITYKPYGETATYQVAVCNCGNWESAPWGKSGRTDTEGMTRDVWNHVSRAHR